MQPVKIEEVPIKLEAEYPMTHHPEHSAVESGEIEEFHTNENIPKSALASTHVDVNVPNADVRGGRNVEDNGNGEDNGSERGREGEGGDRVVVVFTDDVNIDIKNEGITSSGNEGYIGGNANQSIPNPHQNKPSRFSNITANNHENEVIVEIKMEVKTEVNNEVENEVGSSKEKEKESVQMLLKTLSASRCLELTGRLMHFYKSRVTSPAVRTMDGLVL